MSVAPTDYSLDRGLPASPEAERSILGGILLDNSMANEALETLKSDHFFLDSHRRIFQRIAELDENRLPIDIVTLTNELLAHKELEQVGGAGYLASLTDGVPRRSSVAHYVRIVKDKYLLRNLIHTANGVIAQCMEQHESVQEIVSKGQSSLMNIATQTGGAVTKMFVNGFEFVGEEDSEPDWLVEGLIEVGSNGFICANPKGAKSLNAMGLAIALINGTSWLGFNIPKKNLKVAIVSREDNPSTTRRRMKKINWAGWDEELSNLFINTKANTDDFKLDNPEDVRNLIVNLKELKPDFLILDVLNVLHSGDENDNAEMRNVLQQCTLIQEETGAQVCIIHHYNKGEGKTITQRMRGSSAISGFAEWIVGLEEIEDTDIRKASFEVKGGEKPQPVHFKIVNNEKGGITFETVDYTPTPERKRTRKKKDGGLFKDEE